MEFSRWIGSWMMILLVVSSYTQETLETVYYLAKESLSRRHGITVFFNSDSTLLLNSNLSSPFLMSFMDMDVRLLACRTSVLDRDLASRGDLIEKAELSSLGELVSLIEEADRTLFLG